MAISATKHHIVHVNEATFCFSYKDYSDEGRLKQMALSNEDFVRRFAQHILPLRFVRIQHYGIVSSTWKRGKLQALQKSLQADKKIISVNTLLRKCPCCKTGTLVTIEVFGKRGPPERYFMEKQMGKGKYVPALTK